jgi:hypothetical protein
MAARRPPLPIFMNPLLPVPCIAGAAGTNPASALVGDAVASSRTVIPIRALPDDFLPRKCTFSHDDWNIPATHWFPVSCIVDMAAKPMAVTLLDVELGVYRTPQACTWRETSARIEASR